MTAAPTPATRDETLPVTGTRLWIGVLFAPGAWVLSGAVGYWLAERSCEPVVGGVPMRGTSHPAVVEVIVMAAALVVALAGCAVALRNWRTLRAAPRPEAFAAWGRAVFMALGGVITSVVFAVGIVLFALPAFLTSACSQFH
jgi:hypothetical protein